jgi:site-specific recombinase XerD
MLVCAELLTWARGWETLLLLADGIEPTRTARGQRPSNRKALAQINLHWHDLRHEALSRLADDGVPVHELQMLAGHANITTTQRYMNARANSLAESMRQARARRSARVATRDEKSVQAG